MEGSGVWMWVHMLGAEGMWPGGLRTHRSVFRVRQLGLALTRMAGTAHWFYPPADSDGGALPVSLLVWGLV